MRKFKGEQLIVDEVYATPQNVNVLEVTSAPSIKHKNLGQLLSSYNQRQSMMIATPAQRQPRVYSCYADFKLPKFPESLDHIPMQQPRRFSSHDIPEINYEVTPSKVDENSEEQKKTRLRKKFDLPKLRRLSIPRSISDSFNTPATPPSFVRKIQNRLSSLKLELNKGEDENLNETEPQKQLEKGLPEAPLVGEDAYFNDQSSIVASAREIEDSNSFTQSHSHQNSINDEISLLSLGTLESILKGYTCDVDEFLSHKRQPTGTSSVYDEPEVDTQSMETAYLTLPSDFSSRFADSNQSPHSTASGSGSISLFSTQDSSGDSCYTDALSYTSSNHFKSLKNNYSQKPLPAPPIFTFNQGDVRNYDHQENMIIDTGIPPQVPKHHCLEGKKVCVERKDNTEWGADAEAAIPNQKVVVPKDTSIFTRQPTYSKIKKQYGDIPILSNRNDEKEEKDRSASLQYLQNAGIEPFMLTGYQECTKLKIVN